MKTRKIIGYIMMAIPVVALFVLMAHAEGFLIMLCALGAVLLVIGWVALAAWLTG